MDKPIFSIITLAYQRVAYLKESLGAMLRQTYPYIEIIIIDNGAIPEVYDYITGLEQRDSRVKVVHFKENQYRRDDFENLIKVCFNAGLKAATGEFVFYQSDDDLIADDYVEKMVKLFEGNPHCTSAAGLTKDIDESGRLLDEGPRISNYRPRYMPGHLLALSTLNRALQNTSAIMFGVPGSIFAFRRQELLRFGGYHALVELSHLYGIVPFGVTGFDETAILYWRRHDGQLNKYMNMHGVVGIESIQNLLRDWQIEERWQVFGKGAAQYVARHLYRNACEEMTIAFVINLYYFRLKACSRILMRMWYRFYFWRRFLPNLWIEKVYIKYALKPLFRKIFESYPWLVSKFPKLLSLQERAFK